MFHDFIPIVSISWWIKAEKFHCEAQNKSICYDLSSFKLLLGVLLQLALANPGSGVLKRLKSSGFIEHLGQEWIFLTAGEGTQVCSQLLRKNSNDALPTDRKDTGPQS
jgi:hypothetical protein